MAEVPPPPRDEVEGWIGCHLDEVGGGNAGEVYGFFVDADSDRPTWLIAKQGSRFSRSLVVVPLRDCAAGAGRVWVAHPGRTIRSSPVVDPRRPLLREHELTICAHYGVGDGVGRAAEVAGREAGAITSRPG